MHRSLLHCHFRKELQSFRCLVVYEYDFLNQLYSRFCLEKMSNDKVGMIHDRWIISATF